MDEKLSIHVKINALAIVFFVSLAFGQTGREIAIMVDELPSPVDLSNESTMVLTNSINIKYLHFKLYLYNSYIKYKDTNYKDKLFKIDKKEYDKIKKIYDILCIY